jgi:hypothetical protein
MNKYIIDSIYNLTSSLNISITRSAMNNIKIYLSCLYCYLISKYESDIDLFMMNSFMNIVPNIYEDILKYNDILYFNPVIIHDDLNINNDFALCIAISLQYICLKLIGNSNRQIHPRTILSNIKNDPELNKLIEVISMFV